MGYPRNIWFIIENSIRIDDLRGTPSSGNLHIMSLNMFNKNKNSPFLPSQFFTQSSSGQARYPSPPRVHSTTELFSYGQICGEVKLLMLVHLLIKNNVLIIYINMLYTTRCDNCSWYSSTMSTKIINYKVLYQHGIPC